ncbi:MAG: T9SS type A sorting domain-containing protein [candidate division Zixibacteria bacterium]|nr:T9SS type A sorting domain-containing protein [Candidatus Tariuqbacter arcticus]
MYQKAFILWTVSIITAMLCPIVSAEPGWNVDMLGNTYHEWEDIMFIEISGDYAYVANGWKGIVVMDISDPANPFEANALNFESDIRQIVVSGDYLYVTSYNYGRFRVFDISNTAQPVQVGNLNTSYNMNGLVVSGDFAYVSYDYNYDHFFAVMDISHPNNPYFITSLYLDGLSGSLEVVGDIAYVTSWDQGLYAIDISNPRNPEIIARCPTNLVLDGGITISDTIISVTSIDGISTIDISDPINPTLIGECPGPGSSIYICERDGYVYGGSGDDGLAIFDITDPYNPVYANLIQTGGFSRGTAILDNYLFLSDCGFNIFYVFDITAPVNPVQVGNFAAGCATDAVVQGDYAYLAAGYGGLKVVDISDYTDPQYVGYYMSPGYSEGIDVADTIACVAAIENGLRLIDVSDPSAPVEVGVFEDWTHIYDVKVIGNLAYAASSGAGVTIIDVADPFNPVMVGITYLSFDARGIDVEGDYAYIAVHNETMPIFDISDPSNPTMVGIYYGSPYYHGYNVDVCGNYAYFCTGSGGFHIVDISDPVHPALMAEWDSGSNVADIIVVGDYAYIACSLWGIKIVNVSNPANPYEVGKYVTRGQGAQGIDAIGEYAFLPDDEFFHILDVSAAIGNVSPLELTIEPANPPVIIPAIGGEFQFGVEVENPNTVSIGFDLWGQIDLPVGGLIETFFVEEFQLGGGSSNLWHFEQTVPFNAPSGQYIYYAYIGEYPWAVAVYDSFTFEKEGGDFADYIVNPDDWGCWQISVFDNIAEPIASISDYMLFSAYPNPFNAQTAISYQLQAASFVTLVVYDVMGREAAVLVDGWRSPGVYETVFDGGELSSGVYFAKMNAGLFNCTQKLILMK